MQSIDGVRRHRSGRFARLRHMGGRRWHRIGAVIDWSIDATITARDDSPCAFDNASGWSTDPRHDPKDVAVTAAGAPCTCAGPQTTSTRSSDGGVSGRRYLREARRTQSRTTADTWECGGPATNTDQKPPRFRSLNCARGGADAPTSRGSALLGRGQKSRRLGRQQGSPRVAAPAAEPEDRNVAHIRALSARFQA